MLQATPPAEFLWCFEYIWSGRGPEILEILIISISTHCYSATDVLSANTYSVAQGVFNVF